MVFHLVNGMLPSNNGVLKHNFEIKIVVSLNQIRRVRDKSDIYPNFNSDYLMLFEIFNKIHSAQNLNRSESGQQK